MINGDIYSQVLKFRSELEEDEIESFEYEEEEEINMYDDFYDDYIWESEDE